jgi:hypothetical protein
VALEQAERDPELRAWFESQRKFDTAVSAKLQTISPPAGLREAILAGARMSAAQPKPFRWNRPIWLAAAAVLALTAILGVKMRTAPARPTAAEFAAFALSDLSDAHGDHEDTPPELANVQAQLVNTSVPLSSGLNIDLGELSKHKCRSLTVGGRRVFELCFLREGAWYHVYIGRRTDFAPGSLDPKALMNVRGEYAATSWADAKHVYALVTQGGVQALRRVI